jgi:hypothetical protein
MSQSDDTSDITSPPTSDATSSNETIAEAALAFQRDQIQPVPSEGTDL